MTNTGIQSALPFSKTVRPNPEVPKKSEVQGTVPNKVSTFMGTLQNVLAKEPIPEDNVSTDVAKLLQ
ncbi:MAG TPA: hypothetical protein VFT51_13430, partial [Bacillales bacterium]|nr:hypothetical protein [Bacillales bacterium]